MNHSDLNRRDFTKLTMAAFGGVLTGTLAGCGRNEPPQQEGTGGGPPADDASRVAASDNPLLNEPHVCRGLNTCKGLGKGGDNACAGQGKCASVKEHACGTQNECKGQGGCGETPGQNACAGKGNCAVPLMEHIWKDARAAFEKLMKEAGKEVGPAPPE